LAPVLGRLLGRRSLTEFKPPTFVPPTVDDHVHGLAGEDMLEVCEARRRLSEPLASVSIGDLPPSSYSLIRKNHDVL